MGAPDSSIRSAFVTKLQTFSPLPSVAWENMPFTPVIGTPYIRPFLLTGEPFQAEIGTAGANRHTGLYQISLYYPAGKGVLALGTLRDALIDHFKRGTTLTYSSLTIIIQKAYSGPIMQQETDWIHQPITIQYQLLAPN
jgi:hypothetical protein